MTCHLCFGKGVKTTMAEPPPYSAVVGEKPPPSGPHVTPTAPPSYPPQQQQPVAPYYPQTVSSDLSTPVVPRYTCTFGCKKEPVCVNTF